MRGRIPLVSALCLVLWTGLHSSARSQDANEVRRSALDELTKQANEKLDRVKHDAAREGAWLADKLKKVLPDLDAAKIKEVMAAQLDEGARTLRKTKDVKDPGPALPVGVGGRVDLDDLPKEERIIGGPGENNLLPVAFLEKGAVVQRSVGRVTLTVSHAGLSPGDGWGTGFLVGDSLFMTNNHVIPDKDFAKKVEVQFNVQKDLRGRLLAIDPFEFDADAFFLTDPALDFSLIRLKPSDRTPPPGLAAPLQAGAVWGHLRLNSTLLFAVKQPMNIVQHPAGRPKEVALQDNILDKVFADVVRYTTDTEPGSSGSPVFNNSWDLVALHHSAGDQQGGVFVNNEGIRIDRIVQFLKQSQGSTPAGLAILTELGL